MKEEIDIRVQILEMEIDIHAIDKKIFKSKEDKIKKVVLTNNITILKWVLGKEK